MWLAGMEKDHLQLKDMQRTGPSISTSVEVNRRSVFLDLGDDNVWSYKQNKPDPKNHLLHADSVFMQRVGTYHCRLGSEKPSNFLSPTHIDDGSYSKRPSL